MVESRFKRPSFPVSAATKDTAIVAFGCTMVMGLIALTAFTVDVLAEKQKQRERCEAAGGAFIIQRQGPDVCVKAMNMAVPR